MPLTSGTSGVAPILVLPECSPSVIINADDWGFDCRTTDRVLECFRAGALSSVSAMVYMADSERAAEIARLHRVDAGLHLNFTAPYSSRNCPARLMDHQQKISRVLTAHRYASALYHPRLSASFEYVVKAQIEEFHRLYGAAPTRFDGHHHMHLCANVLLQRLLPRASIVRRNLSFGAGEKHFLNRLYRRVQDWRIARRHQVTDYFFDLVPFQSPARIDRIFDLGTRFNVEVEAHPAREGEYGFLMGEEIQRRASESHIAKGYVLRSQPLVHTRENMA